MRTVDNTNPTYVLRRSYTGVLSLPVSAKVRAKDDAQGTVGLFFHKFESIQKSQKGPSSQT